MPRRSVATCRAHSAKRDGGSDAKAGPILSANELRLGKPRLDHDEVASWIVRRYHD